MILPNYNHGRYLGRAINALLSQERLADEIIIVDDASTDDSLATIEALSVRSPRITVVNHSANRGVNAALLSGLERASGNCIVFGGADDWVMPGFFELGLRMLATHAEAGLFCGEAVLVDGDTGRTIGYRPPARPLYQPGVVAPAASRQLLARMDNFIHTGAAIFRREALVAAGGLNDQLGAFADGFLTRKIALTYGFCYAPQVVACWCVFLSGLSRTTALNPAKARDALKQYPAQIASDPAFPDWYTEVFRKRWRFATARLALQATAPDFDFVGEMAAPAPIDRTVLGLIRATLRGRLQRITLLGWLWLRWRPYRLVDLLHTALARRREQRRGGLIQPEDAGLDRAPRATTVSD